VIRILLANFKARQIRTYVSFQQQCMIFVSFLESGLTFVLTVKPDSRKDTAFLCRTGAFPVDGELSNPPSFLPANPVRKGERLHCDAARRASRSWPPMRKRPM
jgi:hypothetical protein